MDRRQIDELLVRYDQTIAEALTRVTLPDRRHTADAELAHLRTMIRKMTESPTAFSEAKINRWLGFIQGVLWHYELYSIEQMRDHNR